MNIINLTDTDGWKKYKQDTVITGYYINFQGRPDQDLRNKYPFIAATGPQGHFYWLLAADDWVLRTLFNYRACFTLDGSEVLYPDIFKTKVDCFSSDLHPWQKDFLDSVYTSVTTGQPYRKGLVVGLGGGKTLATLLLGNLTDSDKFLYICPKHLKSTIKAECAKWGLPVPVITTPESAKKHAGTNWQIAVIDECLSVKNPLATRSKGVREVLSNCPVVVAMTGTPMSAKHCLDLRWLRVCGTVFPELEKNIKWLWGNNPHYKDLSKLGVRTTKLGANGEPARPLEVDSWRFDEVSEFLSDSMKVVDIADIQQQIPEKQYQVVELPRPKAFRLVLQGLVTDRGRMKALTQARTASSGFVYADNQAEIWLEKKPAKIEWIKGFIKDNPDEPLVVFANWRAELTRVSEELKALGCKISVVHDKNNSSEIEKFVKGETDIIVVSASITEGMNLQRSRIEIFMSNATRPDRRIQAEGRTWRHGQNRGVVIYDLICKDTLDQPALELLQSHIDESKEYIEAQLNEALSRMLSKIKRQ